MLDTDGCKYIVTGLVIDICSDLLDVQERLPNDWENLEPEIAQMASKTALVSCQLAAYAGVAARKQAQMKDK